MGELVEATAVLDVPNPDKGDELNVEPNVELLGCQLEAPNKLEPVPLLELTDEEEADVPSPNVVPELKTLVVELVGNIELPEEKDVFVAELKGGNNELPEEISVLPVDPNNGDDADN